MQSELLKKLKHSQQNAKKIVKRKLTPTSTFATLTDDEIAQVIAMRAKELRIKQDKKQREFSTEAELSSPTTYANFEQKGIISLANFIKVMRTFGRLEELEALLRPTVKEQIEDVKANILVPKKRVR
ncbi:hypothetical protein [Sulfurospirillum multivorans]|uniref:HTH cro/C1-type domain-containing protein n=2 Tax=Sulfurospirillum multivorans TaxID=66821 RepID=A0AA86AKV0_SULMK|nr:hypothetical protein [Sulfurospirillum multivorans]AHJ11368.1 hypothetical protein SMUL_0081 [Sulfurospirillum multivorans DSM 12446]QEH04872.1 hypothetical protein SMN_0079 [Sulfurospirillum multivorans]